MRLSQVAQLDMGVEHPCGRVVGNPVGRLGAGVAGEQIRVVMARHCHQAIVGHFLAQDKPWTCRALLDPAHRGSLARGVVEYTGVGSNDAAALVDDLTWLGGQVLGQEGLEVALSDVEQLDLMARGLGWSDLEVCVRTLRLALTQACHDSRGISMEWIHYLVRARKDLLGTALWDVEWLVEWIE